MKEEHEDKVLKKDFLQSIDRKELKKENEKYYSEKNINELITMMSVKVARIEKILIWMGTFMIIAYFILLFVK